MKTAQLITFTKEIPTFPNYRISPDGTVWSNQKKGTSQEVSDTWKQLKPVLDKGVGYFLVTLCLNGKRKNQFIHRLLAQAYIPNPDNKAHVNHIDADKTNNVLSNLEWATPQENSSHAARLGLYQPSIDSTRRDVIQLDMQTGNTLQHYPSLHEAERQTGIAWQNIWKVCDGRRRSAGGYQWQYQ